MKIQLIKWTLNSLVYVLIIHSQGLFAQTKSANLSWYLHLPTNSLLFEGSQNTANDDAIFPLYQQSIEIKTQQAVVTLYNMHYSTVNNSAIKDKLQPYIANKQQLESTYSYERKKKYLSFEVVPFRIINDTLQRLISFEYLVEELGPLTGKTNYTKTRRWASNSVLNTGDWYKIKTEKTGIYKITGQELSDMGVDLSSLDPKTLKVFGNHGYMLPELNSIQRHDDLQENAIIVNGETDGSMSTSDYILFYAESPHKWVYNSTNKQMEYQNNIYSDESYYFLTHGSAPGKRITTQGPNNQLSEERTFTSFDFHKMHQKDLVNHLKSGREWYGETFDAETNLNIEFEFKNLVTTHPIKTTTQAISRSGGFDNSFTISANNAIFSNYPMAKVPNPSETQPQHSYPYIKNDSFYSNSDKINIHFKYSKPSSTSIAWLDYFSLSGKREAVFENEQDVYYNLDAANFNTIQYKIEAKSNFTILNINDPFNPFIQGVVSNGSKRFFKVENKNKVEKYLLFGNDFLKSEFIEKMNNQNLHGLSPVKYLIITHSDFKEAADTLLLHRKSQGISGHVILVDQIFNEYSSGAGDVIAIRDFIKSVYDKSTGPSDLLENVLFFGDASYDYKDRIAGNNNFVPTYESHQSYDPIGSYCSNDYFAFLDSTEGEWEKNSSHKMDINVGRIPVNTAQSAKEMVDKIKYYESPESLGDWRNRLVYGADDSDLKWDTIHLRDAEDIYRIALQSDKVYNNYKIYTDAYEQKSIGNASRYPDATADFNKYMDQGALVINYTGHGGEQGLAEERLIDIPTVNSWSNRKNMPLFITATCEFSRYDDPKRFSAGELSILNPDGGMIALLTTVRVVNAGPNKVLNARIWTDNLLNDLNEVPCIGDVFTKCKNTGTSWNDRNFTLLGDPAMKLAYPTHEVITDSINGQDISIFKDTLGALDLVTVSGHMETKKGNILSSFNGTVYPIVFDKTKKQHNLQNDENSVPQQFDVQNDILFRGKVQVTNGYFSFSFVLPKDINYNIGNGRISYYADNGLEDGHGYYNDIIIGGSNPNSSTDTTPPEIELWMDDYSFKFGGSTNNSPLLLARVFDENGINTSTSGIGREILATLDKGTENQTSFILNDYYESFLNSYKEGEVRYPLHDLSEGRHTIHVKFWDTYNNSAEGYTEFVVNNEEVLEINDLYAYPNPFKNTTTISIDHNQAGKDLKVSLDFFDSYGKSILSVEKNIKKAPSIILTDNWEELRDLSHYMSPGIYFYQVTIENPEIGKAKKVSKIICIN